jgi:spermidine/putrescine transport system substrate-binding protein
MLDLKIMKKNNLINLLKIKNIFLSFFLTITFVLISNYIFNFITKYKYKKYISVLAWAGSFDPEVIRNFEEKTGIKVFLTYFSSNEELISKMSFEGGKGIDIVVPSDYAISVLSKMKLIKPLNQKNIESFDNIYEDLLKSVKKENKLYGIPIEWSVYGLVMEASLYQSFESDDDIAHSFFIGKNENRSFRICMAGDMSSAINLAFMYYRHYFKNHDVNDRQSLFTIIYEILKKQKNSVIIYSDTPSVDLFASNSIDIACIQSDRYLKIVKTCPNLIFISPTYGSLRVNEYIAISEKTDKIEESYQFINYILDTKTMAKNIKQFCFFPTRKDFNENLENKKKVDDLMKHIFEIKTEISKTKEILNNYELISLWIKLKSN